MGDDPYLGATVTTYNASGQAVQVTNPLGGITLTGYDGAGNVTQTTAESNNSAVRPQRRHLLHLRRRRPAISTTVDPGGSLAATTDQAYDPDGNVYCTRLGQRRAAGRTTSARLAARLDQPSRPSPTVAVLDDTNPAPGQQRHHHLLQRRRQPAASTNPDVETTVTAYDADGRTYCSSDPTNVSAWLAANPGHLSLPLPSDPAATAPASGSTPAM